MSQPSDSDDDSASASSEKEVYQRPEMVSDGRRMRMVWQPGDGDGDSSAHIVERAMNLVRGHPTWKIYVDDVPLPIVRGSDTEPPHYVYLDDRACNAIYLSKAYSNQEMRDFYPFDFNHQGHIKTGRKNRGNPAYLDDSNTVFAQAPLRGKNKWYTFSGAPEVTEYQPARPQKPSKIEEEVKREFEEKAGQGVVAEHMFKSNTQVLEKPVRNTTGISPAGTPKGPLNNTNPRTPKPSSSTPPMVSSFLKPTKATTPSFDADPDPKARPRQPRLASQSPYENMTPSPPRYNSPATPEGLGKFNPHRLLAKNSPSGSEGGRTGQATPMKRQFVTPTESSRPKKRLQISPSSEQPNSPGFGGDGAHDDDQQLSVKAEERIGDDNGYAVRGYLIHQQREAEYQQMKSDLEASKLHVAKVEEERDVYREVIVRLLAGRISQYNDLTDRVISLQSLSDSLEALKFETQDLVDTAKKEIEPTASLSDGLHTLMEGPQKYIYSKGMDEAWKSMYEEARKFNAANAAAGLTY